jgi:hypothetical protein
VQDNFLVFESISSSQLPADLMLCVLAPASASAAGVV